MTSHPLEACIHPENFRCIYSLTHKRTGKFYLGSTYNLPKRLTVWASVINNTELDRMPWPMQEHIRACKLVGTPVMANEWVYSVSTVLPVKVTDRATLRGLSASQRPEWPLVQHALQKMPSRVLNNPNARRQVQPAQGVAAGKVGPSAYAYLNAKLGHGRRGKGNLAIMSSQPPSTRAIDYRVVPHIGDPHMPYPLYLLRCMKMAPDMASATERTKRLLHPSNENIATHYSEWLAQVTRGKPSLVAMLPAQVTCIDDTLKIRWVDPSRVHQ